MEAETQGEVAEFKKAFWKSIEELELAVDKASDWMDEIS